MTDEQTSVEDMWTTQHGSRDRQIDQKASWDEAIAEV